MNVGFLGKILLRKTEFLTLAPDSPAKGEAGELGCLWHAILLVLCIPSIYRRSSTRRGPYESQSCLGVRPAHATAEDHPRACVGLRSAVTGMKAISMLAIALLFLFGCGGGMGSTS